MSDMPFQWEREERQAARQAVEHKQSCGFCGGWGHRPAQCRDAKAEQLQEERGW